MLFVLSVCRCASVAMVTARVVVEPSALRLRPIPAAVANWLVVFAGLDSESHVALFEG